MKNRLAFSVLLVVLVAACGWSQFYFEYSAAERKELSEAYYLAGRQYAAVGKQAKGDEYVQMARNIWPDLDPAAIKDEQLPSAAELLARGGALVIGATEGQQAAARTISSFFLRFVGALLDEDSAAAAGFLDGSVYLARTKKELSRADAQNELAALFASVDLGGLAPSSIYDLDSVVIVAAPQSLSAAWGESWILRVDARTDFSAYLPFWETKQQFYIRLADRQRAIAAIGQDAPPAGWKPAPAPAAPARAAAAATAGDVSQAIVDAFKGCVSAFLKKNAEAAITFMTPEVRLVRLRQTVSREELRSSFIGAFESADFGSTAVDDLVDTSTMFVEGSKDFASEMPGDVYLLTARARVDLADTIPFWTTWQGYYFQQDGGNWRIFAIR